MNRIWINRVVKYSTIAAGAFILAALILFAIVVYVRNWDGGDADCPNMKKSEISAYMNKYIEHNNMSNVDIDNNFIYSVDLRQWKIRYSFGGYRYEAEMTCFGYIVENERVYD